MSIRERVGLLGGHVISQTAGYDKADSLVYDSAHLSSLSLTRSAQEHEGMPTLKVETLRLAPRAVRGRLHCEGLQFETEMHTVQEPKG